MNDLQIRVHGDSSKPTHIYLPGLHGDWTLVSSFRQAMKDSVQFVEFTYPRTLNWSLHEHAEAILGALRKNQITQGWLLAESFGSILAWAVLEKDFAAQGVILAGGFVRYPFMPLVRLAHWLNSGLPNWGFVAFCRFYAAYAKLRHRNAPETFEAVNEFLRRRTEPGDREALCHRYRLIQQSDARILVRSLKIPVYHLCGVFDPIVPWWAVRKSLLRGCATFRNSSLIWRADHNVLGTAPGQAAERIMAWIRCSEAAAPG
ncbi:MAG TPA: alpha/beta hydrolase [Verrucomicrobiae bacterium]|nr:alpha/beta hydrolase [Verrucomicrobiae bacterium]